MFPRWHVILGALFTFAIWLIAPDTRLVFLALVFLASVFIDFDHYVVAVIKTGKFRFVDAYSYHEMCSLKHRKAHRRGIRRKLDFHLFHTIEFHVLIGVLGVFFIPFFYIFLGMVFHSLTDLFYLMKEEVVYAREFFFFNWLRKRF